MKPGRQLTPNQQRYVDAYAGDIKAAAKIAKISYAYARTLNTRDDIKAAIRKRTSKGSSATGRIIKTREQRQAFWSNLMDDKNEQTKDRLKASELLGRSEADFTDKREHSGNVNITVRRFTGGRDTTK